jgi:DHA3 family macrolide efflux protein-like MFS transporter
MNKSTNFFTRKVILFLISQNFSLFGSSLVGFAIIWHITLRTSSGTWLMLSTLATMVPYVLISPWGGVWADRHNRKHLIMLADAFIAFATLGLAISYMAGFRSLSLLLAVSVVRSLGAGIQQPAVNAIYPQLVAPEGLSKVQGVNQSLNAVLALLAPAAGGFILGSFGLVWAFMTDVITAGIAIIIMSLIRVEKITRTDAYLSFYQDIRQGLRYAYRSVLLKRLIIINALSFFLITPAAILSPLQVGRSFGNDVWRLTANEMVWGIGSLIGGLFVAFFSQNRDKVKIISICLFAFGISFALLGLVPTFGLYLAVMLVAGFFLPLLSTAQTVFVQELTEAKMMGRVFSLLQIVSGSAMPVAILVFGPLADLVSIESIMLVSGLLLAVVALVFFAGTHKLASPRLAPLSVET